MELASDTTFTDTTNLLRPHQVIDAKEELQSLSATLNGPSHIRSRISDLGLMRQRRDNLAKELEKFTPKPFTTETRDTAISEFHALEDKIREGMPSSEEMRRNPPGAVGKQLSWDKAQRNNVLRYKNLALRLHAGGDLPADMRYEGDIANIERLRPLTTIKDVSMDYAQIPKTRDIHIGSDPVGTVMFTADEEAALMDLAPALAGSLAVLDNEARAQIKGLLKAAAAQVEAKAEKPKLHELTYNEMKKMCADAGMPEVRKATKTDCIAYLRNRHLIQ